MSLLLLPFTLALLLLFLRERISHQEFAVLRILLGFKIALCLRRHEDSPFEGFHDRNVDVSLILFFALDMRSRQIISYRLDLL